MRRRAAAAARPLCRAEPKRTIGLVRRSLSVDDGWFGELAAILSDAGELVIRG